MREVPLANCEKEFLLKAIADKRRLDGRETFDYRRMKITFGVDRGCCSVELGNTRVLVQVSCQVTEPKQSRLNEGVLFVNVELSPMAAPHFETGRQSEYGVEITRLLERCIKESRCVDMESLCIMAGVKVWTVRVDIHILNHDGNLVDCGSVAAIAALAHFRRPDVTVSGEEVIIHSLEDKDPVPLSVHHMPICVTFAFFQQGKYLLVDPTEKEERVMDGKMVIAMNKHREICTMQMTGNMLLLKDQVLRCSNVAVVKVAEITELIQRALANDAKVRSEGGKFGFAMSVETNKLTAAMTTSQKLDALPAGAEDSEGSFLEEEEEEDSMDTVKTGVKILAKGTGRIGEGGPSSWGLDDADTETVVQDKIHELRNLSRTQSKASEAAVVVDSDSEEEQQVTLDQEDLGFKKSSAKEPSPTQTIDLTGAPSPSQTIDLTAALKKPKSKKNATGKKKGKKT